MFSLLLIGRARELRAPGATAIVTGQQAGLFGGPIFVLWKALATVRVARLLEKLRARPVVPVFWVASDDHDFAEIRLTCVIDATGKVVAPGFVDSHVHFVSGSANLAMIDLAGTKTVEEIQGRIRAFVQENPGSAWVQGRGWMYPAFPGNMPHKKFLDEVVPDRPAGMRCADGHSSWVNSRALALAGIGHDTKDTENGKIVRDGKGEATGALLESASSLVSALIPEPTQKPGPGR